jgi:hypothetical protein
LKKIIFCIILCLTTFAYAQHQHSVSPVPVPVTDDLQAWEHFLYISCDRPSHTAQEKSARAAIRGTYGLEVFAEELKGFCAKYDAEVAKTLKFDGSDPNESVRQQESILALRGLIQDELSTMSHINPNAAGRAFSAMREIKANMRFIPELDNMGIPVVLPASYFKGKLKKANQTDYQYGFTFSTVQALDANNPSQTLYLDQIMTTTGTYSTTQCTYGVIDQYGDKGWEPAGCPAYHQPTQNNWLSLTDGNGNLVGVDYGGWFNGGSWFFSSYMNWSTTAVAPFSPGQIWSTVKIYSRIFCTLANSFIAYVNSEHDSLLVGFQKVGWTGGITMPAPYTGGTGCNTSPLCSNPGPYALIIPGVDVGMDLCAPAWRTYYICHYTPDGARHCGGTLWIDGWHDAKTGAPGSTLAIRTTDVSKVPCTK